MTVEKEFERAELGQAVELLSAWKQLTELLDVRAGEDTYACPICGELGFASAKRCGYCWTTLTARRAFSTASSLTAQ